jgi:NAD+ kinase
MDHPVIGLVANTTKPNAAELTKLIASQFRQGGARLLCEKETAALAGEPDGMPLKEVAAECTVLVVLGGDGTILHTARQLGSAVRPLAAVNTGRLGFLTTATADETEMLVRAVLSGGYHISQRRTIEASFTAADGRMLRHTGLNEALISRGAISRVVRLNVTINGAFVTCYSGDGLIVSTPTGSTAYSLSAGGPIVNPEAGVFCITPICPHAVSNRSLVVNDDATVEITSAGSAEDLILNIDGGSQWTLNKDNPVTLRRGAWTVPLVTMPGVSFYGVLRQKLQWNGSSV